MTNPSGTGHTIVLEARLGFSDSHDTRPVPSRVAGLHIIDLLAQGHKPRYTKLRVAGTPIPNGARNIVQVHGGCIDYQWAPTVQDASAGGWVNELAGKKLKAFVATGTFGSDGFRMLPADARTRDGYMVIYTRWNVFDPNGSGEVTNIGFCYRQLRFDILDDSPPRGDVLRIRRARPGGWGKHFVGDLTDHLDFVNEPEPWMELIHAASDGYDRECQVNSGGNP